MPKSKGRKHPQQKKKTVNVLPSSASKTATAEPAVKMVAKAPALSPATSAATPRPYPYLRKELVKVGIVTGICLAVLIILTRTLA